MKNEWAEDIRTFSARISWRLWVLIGLAFLVYSPALRGGFLWDDDDYVVKNMALRTLAGLWTIWSHPGALSQYYPLTYTSFWINYHLGGLNTAGYHAVNILLHALNSLLVWRLLERLKIPGAWFAGLIFLVHPVHVESVAWITERKNVLSGFFYLSAFLSYLRFKNLSADQPLRDGSPAREPFPADRGNRRWYFISFALFLGALLSKTITATFPAAVILVLWWKNGRFPLKDLARMVPLLFFGMVLGVITMHLENGHIMPLQGSNDWDLTASQRFLIAGRALWFYLGKLAWPHPSTLAFIYPRWEIDPSALWQWLFPLSFILLLALLWRFRSRWGRGPLTALVFFTVTLLPALGFRNFFPMRFSFVADHFQYLAAIGPISCAVAIAWTSLGKHPRSRKALGIALLFIFSAFSWKQCEAYKDLETLWRDTLSKNPGAWMAHNNLGAVLFEKGRYQEALSHEMESIRLRPNYADAYCNLGALATAQNDYEKADGYYRRSLEIFPYSSETHNNFGVSLYKSGKTDEAIKHYRMALMLNPNAANTFCNLGNALLVKGETAEAVRQYQNAIRLAPEYADAYANLGLALFNSGQTDKALELYEKAIKLNPAVGMAHHNLANVLASKGLTDLTEYHRREAVRLKPSNIEFRISYAKLLEQLGKTEAAIEQYNEVIQQDPKNPEAQRNLMRIVLKDIQNGALQPSSRKPPAKFLPK